MTDTGRLAAGSPEHKAALPDLSDFSGRILTVNDPIDNKSEVALLYDVEHFGSRNALVAVGGGVVEYTADGQMRVLKTVQMTFDCRKEPIDEECKRDFWDVVSGGKLYEELSRKGYVDRAKGIQTVRDLATDCWGKFTNAVLVSDNLPEDIGRLDRNILDLTKEKTLRYGEAVTGSDGKTRDRYRTAVNPWDLLRGALGVSPTAMSFGKLVAHACQQFGITDWAPKYSNNHTPLCDALYVGEVYGLVLRINAVRRKQQQQQQQQHQQQHGKKA